ncbi:hypothetical protein DAEQUDRAFT_34079 [Daedalea quercina L-15889]|uniref:F-box domain-containing protein n=1 Tax=Daedalea quercina L-15889 TaxID=1314783 RepID=A0A165SRV8_9APHY|nr:hypothetical protein DAEQUDRAFT_34079 [Daedalea quercina L-15889]
MKQHREELDLPTIPPELHEEIIDFVWNDQSTLGVCSLVSRAWLPTARSHKFHTVHLYSQPRRNQFDELLCSPLVDSHNLVHYVRALHLGVHSKDGVDFQLQAVEYAPDIDIWHDRWLFRLLPRFTELDTLRIEHIWWDVFFFSIDRFLSYTRKSSCARLSTIVHPSSCTGATQVRHHCMRDRRAFRA